MIGFGKTNDGKNYWNRKCTWGENWGDGSAYSKIARPSRLQVYKKGQKNKHLMDDFGYTIALYLIY